MRKILILACLLACLLITPAASHALACNLAASPSQATLQAAITAAVAGTCTGTATGSTVALVAGTTSISSALTVGCGTNVVITGPAITWPAAATAVISGTAAGHLIFVSTCTGGLTIEYLNVNGLDPAGGGGGSIFISQNSGNVTVTHNTLQGVQAVAGSGNDNNTLLWFDGANPATTSTNISVTWNQFGGAGDCSAIMSALTDQGGYCAGVGILCAVNGLVIANNTFYHLEEGVKLWAN